jgi:PAS domain S-box-containing protein
MSPSHHDVHVAATSRLMEALVESENRMRQRLDMLADVVVETDANGRVVFLNPAWSYLTGLDPKACVGEPLASYFPGECRRELTRLLTRDSGLRELHTYLDDTLGRRRHVHLTSSPVSQGGVVAVLRDVTADHAIQEELRKLSVVASSTSNLVVITDVEGLIDWVNPAFEQRTGYALDAVRGRKPGSFLQGPDTDPAAVSRIREAIDAREPIREELLNYAKDGSAYWISLNLTPAFDSVGRLERFISIQEDITERKRVERMKTEFVSTVSHELRTPLTSISGSLALLGSGEMGDLPERAEKLVGLAHRNSARLTAIINDLLDMERLLENGLPLTMQVQEIRPIVERALQDNDGFARQHGVTLVLRQACPYTRVNVDSLRLAQVVTNLVSNACKFGPRGSTVDVSITCDASTAQITVADTGPGIPESFREAVFDKFSQVDGSDSRALGGTGLGLSIAKELVERMGGSITFESALGEGTTFVVDIPLAD